MSLKAAIHAMREVQIADEVLDALKAEQARLDTALAEIKDKITAAMQDLASKRATAKTVINAEL